MRPLLFSACDICFFELFAPSLRKSAEHYGNRIQIRCSGEWARTAADRAEHCIGRFRMLPALLARHDGVLVVDTDSLLNGRIEIADDVDIGLMVRGERIPGKKRVKGGAVYFHSRAMKAAEWLRQRLSAPAKWYDDQIALFEMFELFGACGYKFQIFDSDFVSFKYNPVAPIWTAKGPEKLSDRWFAEMCRWHPQSLRPLPGGGQKDA